MPVDGKTQVRGALLSCLGSRRGSGLYVGVQPRVHLPEHVLEALVSLVAVGFEGEEDEADGGTLAFEGGVEALALDGVGAGVVVGFAVDKEDGGLDLVGVGEG